MHYLISVISPRQADTGQRAIIGRFNDRLRDEGHWVFAGGLAAPDTATVVDNRGDQPVLTDGPYLESKEFLGGFWVIEADNLDVALKLAADASKACDERVEIRPFQGVA